MNHYHIDGDSWDNINVDKSINPTISYYKKIDENCPSSSSSTSGICQYKMVSVGDQKALINKKITKNTEAAKIKKIVGGKNHVCVLMNWNSVTKSGTISCTGFINKISNQEAKPEAIPVLKLTKLNWYDFIYKNQTQKILRNFMDIDSSDTHMCGVDWDDRKIYCIGDQYAPVAGCSNIGGGGKYIVDICQEQLNKKADQSFINSDINLNGSTPRRFKSVAVGKFHSCALTEGSATNPSQVFCWGGDNVYDSAGYGYGSNVYKQSDVPSEINTYLPLKIGLKAGDYHTCVLYADLRVKCWGRDAEYQVTYPKFYPISGHSSNAEDLFDLGGNHTFLALKSEEIISVGLNNEYDQSLDGLTTEINNTILTNNPKTSIVKIVSNTNTNCVLYGYYDTERKIQKNKVFCWGKLNNDDIPDFNYSNIWAFSDYIYLERNPKDCTVEVKHPSCVAYGLRDTGGTEVGTPEQKWERSAKVWINNNFTKNPPSACTLPCCGQDENDESDLSIPGYMEGNDWNGMKFQQTCSVNKKDKPMEGVACAKITNSTGLYIDFSLIEDTSHDLAGRTVCQQKDDEDPYIAVPTGATVNCAKAMVGYVLLNSMILGDSELKFEIVGSASGKEPQYNWVWYPNCERWCQVAKQTDVIYTWVLAEIIGKEETGSDGKIYRWFNRTPDKTLASGGRPVFDIETRKPIPEIAYLQPPFDNKILKLTIMMSHRDLYCSCEYEGECCCKPIPPSLECGYPGEGQLNMLEPPVEAVEFEGGIEMKTEDKPSGCCFANGGGGIGSGILITAGERGGRWFSHTWECFGDNITKPGDDLWQIPIVDLSAGYMHYIINEKYGNSPDILYAYGSGAKSDCIGFYGCGGTARNWLSQCGCETDTRGIINDGGLFDLPCMCGVNSDVATGSPDDARGCSWINNSATNSTQCGKNPYCVWNASQGKCGCWFQDQIFCKKPTSWGCLGNFGQGFIPIDIKYNYDSSNINSYDILGISTGSTHTCVIRGINKNIICWGDDNKKQCSGGISVTQITDRKDPILNTNRHPIYSSNTETQTIIGYNNKYWIHKNGPYKKISAASEHTCGLKEDQTVYCWGSNEKNQCNVPPNIKFTDISCGYEITWGITISKQLIMWGKGIQNNDYRTVDSDVIFVSTNHNTPRCNNMCYIKENNKLICTGTDGQGESISVPFITKEKYKSASCGSSFCCGINLSNKLVCFGKETSGSKTSRLPNYYYSKIDLSDRWSIGMTGREPSTTISTVNKTFLLKQIHELKPYVEGCSRTSSGVCFAEKDINMYYVDSLIYKKPFYNLSDSFYIKMINALHNDTVESNDTLTNIKKLIGEYEDEYEHPLYRWNTKVNYEDNYIQKICNAQWPLGTARNGWLDNIEEIITHREIKYRVINEFIHVVPFNISKIVDIDVGFGSQISMFTGLNGWRLGNMSVSNRHLVKNTLTYGSDWWEDHAYGNEPSGGFEGDYEQWRTGDEQFNCSISATFLNNVVCTSFIGDFTCLEISSFTLTVGMTVEIENNHTNGLIIAAGTYKISATNGRSTFSLKNMDNSTVDTKLGPCMGSIFKTNKTVSSIYNYMCLKSRFVKSLLINPLELTESQLKSEKSIENVTIYDSIENPTVDLNIELISENKPTVFTIRVYLIKPKIFTSPNYSAMCPDPETNQPYIQSDDNGSCQYLKYTEIHANLKSTDYTNVTTYPNASKCIQCPLDQIGTSWPSQESYQSYCLDPIDYTIDNCENDRFTVRCEKDYIVENSVDEIYSQIGKNPEVCLGTGSGYVDILYKSKNKIIKYSDIISKLNEHLIETARYSGLTGFTTIDVNTPLLMLIGISPFGWNERSFKHIKHNPELTEDKNPNNVGISIYKIEPSFTSSVISNTTNNKVCSDSECDCNCNKTLTYENDGNLQTYNLFIPCDENNQAYGGC